MHKRPTLLAVLVLLTLIAASCGATRDTGFPPTPTPEDNGNGHGNGNGDDGDPSTREDPFVVEGATGMVDVVDNLFVPRFVQVSTGTTIVWEQTGDQPHNVVFDDESFSSHPECPGTCMSQGDQADFTFEEAGEVPYYCVIHGRPGSPEDPANMAGVIIVV